MELTSKKTVKKILNEKGGSLKRLGQNFLINENTLDQMTKASRLNFQDEVLEIGPGLGALTEKLAHNSKKVIAVEKDDRFISHLRSFFSSSSNVRILNRDILSFSPKDFFKNDYKIISNLPYNIAVPTIRKFINIRGPSVMVFIIQKDVAYRIAAEKKHSFLSVLVHLRSTPEIVCTVSKSSFWPVPDVEGAIIKLTPHQKYPDEKNFNENFFNVVETGFRHPRKQIKNNLSTFESFSKKDIEDFLTRAEVNPKDRPEDLTVEQWIKIASLFDFKKG